MIVILGLISLAKINTLIIADERLDYIKVTNIVNSDNVGRVIEM